MAPVAATSIPQSCTVLVIGGGPGGSYAAAVLAREGVDTVLLEAATFPRYHIGESMLPSIRHLLRFIDLDSTFDTHGFTKKAGAVFKLHPEQQEGYTDFIAAGGPDNYAWNIVRSEADELLFLHARESGAKAFDGTSVTAIQFVPLDNEEDSSSDDREHPGCGRPVSASYRGGSDATSGTIHFKYLVDASGRAGLLSNKYQKTRRYNRGLNNVASWGYWRGTDTYAKGTPRANIPYFEALRDGSGWAWFIPLHNGTTSVGVVMNQDIATSKKKQSSSTYQFYASSLQTAPNLYELLLDGDGGELVSDIKSASDYSYSASSYASPYARIVGDAGCFIDPYFSSGVHLAMVSALSAAITICAVIREDCQESVATKWHSTKVADGYTRFLMVVLSAYKQIRSQNEPVLSDLGENNLDHAFARFRPIIQGTADVGKGVSQTELSETIAFCANAWDSVRPDERAAILQKIQRFVSYYTSGKPVSKAQDAEAVFEKVKQNLSEEEVRVMNYIRARQALRTEDSMNIERFSMDVIDGLAPNVERGNLTLKKATPLIDVGIDTRQIMG
ncbi:MAG: hypothetical protein LQ348_006625 [Seirophora lacunosa]|nr:MAG: hypothetical protein LQ348_006625 [Seirophora lacunosa]